MPEFNSLPYGIQTPVGEELNRLQASAEIFNSQDAHIRRQNAAEERDRRLRADAPLNDPVRILPRAQSPDYRPQSPNYPPPDLSPLAALFDPNDRATTPPRAPYRLTSRLAVAPTATPVLETPVPPAVDQPVKTNAQHAGSRRSVKPRKRKSKKRNMSKMKKRKNKTKKRK